MIDKTRLGLSCFDERYGGLYRKRAALCVGRQGSGKTLLGVQALLQSVKEGERGLMLSAWRAHASHPVGMRRSSPHALCGKKLDVAARQFSGIARNHHQQ